MHKPLYTRRGRLLGRYLMIVVVIVLSAAIFASTAAAAQPIKWVETWTGIIEDAGLCPFPVALEYNSTQTLTAFVNESGEWVMGHHHAVQQDTLRANGKTLVGMPYTYNIHNFYEPNPVEPIWLHGSVPGIYWKFPLPDGKMFISAGQVKCDSEGCFFVGNPGHDYAALCAALAP